MTEEPINSVEYTVQDKVAWLCLNRPAKLNAFDLKLKRALNTAFERFERDDLAEVGILHGAGRAFSSGADITDRHDLPESEMEWELGATYESHLADPLTYSRNWKPVVGAGHGYIVGAALGLFLSCDLTIVATDAQMQIAETSRGLWAGVYWNQVRLRAGVTLADEMALTGRFVSGEEAAARGLVGIAVAPDELLPTAERFARHVMDNPGPAVRAAVMARRWVLNREQRDWPLLKAATPLHQTAEFRDRVRTFVDGEA